MRSLLLLVVALVTLVFTAAAFGHGATGWYARGTYGVGGVYQTGFNHRHFNRVWHEWGYKWTVLYKTSDGPGGTCCIVTDTINPTEYPYEIGYARCLCNNVTDDSGTLWTCQSTGADMN
jgi:hypothetical protein